MHIHTTAALLLLTSAVHAQSLAPFVLSYDDGADSPTDVRRALPLREASSRLTTRDGHLYANNQRLRLFGVNICTGSAFPEKSEAPKVAARLAKFGINTVRFHHIDSSWSNPSIYKNQSKLGTRELNPDSLDRLDFFIRELQKQGIYTNLNTLVSRPFSSKDGLPAEIDQVDWKNRASIGFFYQPLITLQKEYASQLLSRQNPYTNKTYAADPAIAIVEINNENGLIHTWFSGDLDQLPAPFENDLARQWVDYLQKIYPNTATLRTAWANIDEPLGTEMLPALTAANWSLEAHEDARATLTADDSAAKISITTAGTQAWHVQFHKSRLAVTKNKPYTLTFQARADKPRTISLYAGRADKPWTGLGFQQSIRLTDQWQTFTTTFLPNASEPNARIVFGDLAKSTGAVWLREVSLKPGGTVGLSARETLEQKTIPIITNRGQRVWPAPARRDWLLFLYDREAAYWRDMRTHLKQQLNVQAIVMGTIIANSPPNLQAQLDAVDSHAYWHHPNFPGKAWDMNNWTVENQSLFDKSYNTLTAIARQRVAGKPHFVTEYNHPAPNNYASEGPLALATMAALQDWDALYMFDYSNSVVGSQKIDSFFAISQHPTVMANVATAALLFRRGDIPPLPDQKSFAFDPQTEQRLIVEKGAAWTVADLSKLGISAEYAYTHRLAMHTGNNPPGLREPPAKLPDTREFNTTHAQWRFGKDGRLQVVTPKSALAVGFIADTQLKLGPITATTGKSSLNWLTLSLVQTHGDTLAGPGTMLITIAGTAQNTDQQWLSDRKNSLKSWGKPPTLIETIPLTLTLPTKNIKAWPLDNRGQRQQELTPTNTQLQLNANTLWYEVEIK